MPIRLYLKEEIVELKNALVFSFFSYLIILAVNSIDLTLKIIFTLNSIIYSVILYTALLFAHKSGEKFNKYNLSLNFFGIFFILFFITSSIQANEFVFPGFSVIALILSFVIPAIFRFQKNSKIRVAK